MSVATTIPRYSVQPRFDYYVDQTGGSDSNTGQTPALAWKTLAKVAAQSFAAGTRVGFKRGSTWRETVTIPTSGTAAAPIVYGAYGAQNQPLPKFKGSGDYSTLTWSVFSGSIYVARPPGTEPGISGDIFTANLETEVDAFTTQFTSKTTAGTSTLTVLSDTANAAGGTKCAQSTGDGTNSAYATKTITGVGDVYVRAYFKLSAGFTMQGTSRAVKVLGLFSGATEMLKVQIGSTSGGAGIFQVTAQIANSSNIYAGASGDVVANRWYCFEFHYVKGSGANGGGQFYLDGVSKGSLFTQNYAAFNINSIRIGQNSFAGSAPNAPTAGTSVYFDDVRISTTGPIGPRTDFPPPPATNKMAWLDEDTRLLVAATTGAMTAGTFTTGPENNAVYVWTPTSSDPTGHTVEMIRVLAALVTSTKSYVALEDLAVMHTAATGGGGASIFLFNGGSAVPGVAVRRCTVKNNAGNGIYCGATVLVEGNDIHDNWVGVEYPSGDSAGIVVASTGGVNGEVRFNRVAYNYKGIWVLSSGGPGYKVHHNTVLRQRVNGIDFNTDCSANPASVFNNTVWHRPITGDGHGIDCQSAAGGGVTIKDNLVYCDYTTASPPNTSLYALGQTNYTAPVAIDYNLGFKASGCTGKYGKLSTTEYTALSDWQTALSTLTTYSGLAAHDLTGDPLFVDLASEDIRTAANSPARNAGVYAAGLNDGYLGSAPDMGAYEAA